MSKDTGELIIQNLFCQPSFSYILSLVIVQNVQFSQSLSRIHSYIFVNITANRGD